METAKRQPDEPDGCRSRADGSSVCTDTHSAGNGRETAGNESERIRTRRIGSRTQDSPETREIATPELPRQRRKVSIDGGDVYVPINAPIEVPRRRIVFGRAESGDEAIAPSVEGERAGDSDGDCNGGDGDGDDAESGGNVDSRRVEGAQLSTGSQRVRLHQKSQENLPVSSRPPTDRTRRPYGLVRRRRRRGRLKIERINVSKAQQVQNGQMTHLGLDRIAQPPRSAPDRACMVYRPRRQCGRIKIAPINVSRT